VLGVVTGISAASTGDVLDFSKAINRLHRELIARAPFDPRFLSAFKGTGRPGNSSTDVAYCQRLTELRNIGLLL